MPERLIEILVPEEGAAAVDAVLELVEPPWIWRQTAGGSSQFKLVLPAERVEKLVDRLRPVLSPEHGARLLVMPVEAVAVGPEAEEQEAAHEEAPRSEPGPGSRVSREEIYADVKEFTQITPSYLLTVVLSSVVAVIGLANNQTAVVIGAMVIAPLLGPNMALSLATTLADWKLAIRALKTNGVGVLLAALVALVVGMLWRLDPASAEVAARTHIGLGDLVVALASGAAAALAVTSGLSTSLIGVMVAVALLPPLVVSVGLAAGGHLEEALRALLLLAANVICVNLAGVATFYWRGLRPRSWWKAEVAGRATRRAMALWALLLVAVVAIILLSQRLESSG
jgi:uncharacterized hydrophobic protein (TIGR00341 family)